MQFWHKHSYHENFIRLKYLIIMHSTKKKYRAIINLSCGGSFLDQVIMARL
jgi:hypothetical protein